MAGNWMGECLAESMHALPCDVLSLVLQHAQDSRQEQRGMVAVKDAAIVAAILRRERNRRGALYPLASYLLSR